jgi:hypothetical protein
MYHYYNMLEIVQVINPLMPSGNYMSQESLRLYFVFMGFLCFSLQIAVVPLNTVNQLIFVMVKYGVLFEVRTESLNNI